VEIRLQRVYEQGLASGAQVLVDRVWPRGIAKERLAGVRWLPELGPSAELRRWFGHRPERWPEFRNRYREELARPEARQLLGQLLEVAAREPLTLLYGARDRERNQAVVIREVLEELAGHR
jgi:uncharacterized protein YeaO (DUF488 family)